MEKKKQVNEDIPRISVLLTETQLKLIMAALEEHFRIRMGQTLSCELADDLCLQNITLPEEGEERQKVFDDYISRRDLANEKLQEFFNICFGRDWRRTQKTENVQREIDMWSAIRHWLWEQRPFQQRGEGVDSYPVYQWSDQPLPIIRLEEQ